jgi:hypothetical protein
MMSDEKNGEGGRSVSETTLDAFGNPVDGGIIFENGNWRSLFRKGKAQPLDDLKRRERKCRVSPERGQNGLGGMDVDHRASLREEFV